MAELSERQRQLKHQFIENRGYWYPFWQQLLELSPDFFEAYCNFSSVPWRQGVLPPKVKELIYVAVDIATTHLYLPGTRIHMANALRHGATRDEIMEVLQLVSVLGMHACTDGVPILIEELERAGQGNGVRDRVLNEAEQALKDDFIAKRGYWAPLWDDMLKLNPAFFKAYLDFSSVPWVSGVLEPKIKELIYVAIDAATTHLYLPGLRIHIRNAFRHGASREEVMEVLMLVSALGIHAATEGVPILIQELDRAGRDAGMAAQ